ncbi:MAG: Holliday junction branch migration protein RuvA [Actinobacteria bacterium]|nr:Holliday junction branch migration protein RuvA [Actinomycetota bacterium]
MISILSGKVADIALNRVVINVGGVGYEVILAPVFVSQLKVGDEITVHTSSVIREDSWTLYGFVGRSEKELFVELQSVSGVGPKVAYSLISAIPSTELQMAIGTGENSRLEQVPGVGKKMASRIILEMKDRFATNKGGKSEPWRPQVIDALVSLGFQRKDAENAVERARRESDIDFSSLELSEVLRRCLAQSRSK